MDKSFRTEAAFDLYVAATKSALCVCTEFGSVAEFVTACMSYQQDHPELDMVIVFGITLENMKSHSKTH
jgi:hypothetical protein